MGLHRKSIKKNRLTLNNRKTVLFKPDTHAPVLTSRLVKESPNLHSGIASIFNVSWKIKFSSYLEGSNIDDLRRDWEAVGRDIRISMMQFEKQ